ncbi:hypothetical protein [Cellulomonas marina]|uniref:hypothetical protein n=1 Tax=Cellulomonas marina TaxID=988821 RepID=UPI001113B636|nr:hypothetical protein [Cellulomonas marina]GIG29500.1 hypothetical protein Cma02nite_21000 [Cellulomonas marina]
MTTMMKRFVGVAGVSLAMLLGGCVTAQKTPAPASSVSTSVDVPVAEATVSVPASPAIDTSVGALVPQGDVDAAREAGAAVYVSPRGDGSGVVIDVAAGLPAQAEADVRAVAGGIPVDVMSFGQQNLDRAANARAMEDAGVGAFIVIRAPQFEQGKAVSAQYVVLTHGAIAGAKEAIAANPNTIRDSAAEAIAAKQALIDANPGAPIIDTSS